MKILITIAILINLHFGLLAQNEPTLDIVPNPFVDTTSFIFTLPTSDTVSLVVYDRWGQLIDSLVKEQLMAQGTHTVIFVGDTLPEDVYVVALIVDTNVVGKNLVKLNQLVGFENNDPNKQHIKIYPNPTTGPITLTHAVDASATLELYDITGRKVLQQLLNSNDNKVSVGHLLKGIYIYSINTVDGKISRGKLVIE